MYLKLNGSKVLEFKDEEVEGWYYTDKVLTPPSLTVGQRAYIRYDKDIDDFYFENEKGEVI